MNYKFLIVGNQDLDKFAEQLASGGDLEDYEIVNATWNGVAALFVLKEKVGE